MGSRKYIIDAIRQAIKEQPGWFKMADITSRVTEIADHGPVSVQRIAQHVKVYEIPLESRLYGKNRYEYRCPDQ